MINTQLPKKQRKAFSKLLREKLEAAGIKDQILMRFSGKTKWVPNAGTKLLPGTKITKELLQEKFHQEKMMIAQNLQRSIIKKILKMPPSAIQSFLKADLGQLASQVEETEKQSDNQINLEVSQETSNDVPPAK